MATTIKGTRIVWGIPKEQKPIMDLPEGKLRLRFRNNNWGKGFLKTSNGILHFALEDCGDYWKPIMQGANASATR